MQRVKEVELSTGIPARRFLLVGPWIYCRMREGCWGEMVNVSQGGVTAKLTTYKTALYALIVAAAGLGLLWLSNLVWFDSHSALEATANQLGGLLITIGGLGILWDLRGKREIMDEVLEKARIASDVSAAGLDRVTMNWLEVPWDDLFQDAKHVSVFISYGSSWRKVHWTKLQEFAKGEKNSLRLFLPNPDDESTMRVLAQRYDYTLEKIRGNVLETAEEVAKLGISCPADIRIYYRAGDPTYTCYRFDDRVLVTLYSHKRERGDVPTLLVKRGTFRDFFMQDLEAIERQSEPVALADLVGGAK